ncbi:hypothetical protein KPH14_011737 [Odynerus spinipes]|uniref:Amidase domain-containing protein n=1 Tax=Odynerus spinipes TaxID=1348599 RepID=A0AAD9VUL3_9HYME|nr:hypothetical protein KPH14_011737 [Odynerus spinipes]
MNDPIGNDVGREILSFADIIPTGIKIILVLSSWVLTKLTSPNMHWVITIIGVFMRLLVNIVTPIVNYIYGERPRCVPSIKNPLLKLSAATLAKKIRLREISSREVVQAYIERIEEVNPIINAVVEERFEAALKEATICDQNIKDEKVTVHELEKTKPLYGVPFTVKESCALKGLSHTGATLIRQGVKATSDGEAVELMREAGGIPLCVTNTPELCTSFDSCNYLFGRTCNAYDSRYTAGGSSGGEGAIIGTGSSLIGIGSDIGGSIRLPAHFNGIFGHKPTAGVVPLKGHYPYSDDVNFKQVLVIGPLARYAEDLHLAMKVLAVKCNRDLHLDKPVDLKKLNIFYLEDTGHSIGVIPTKPEIRACLKQAVMYLEDCGCTVKEYPRGSLLYTRVPALFSFFSIKEMPQLLSDPNDPKHEKQLIYELPKALFGLSQYTKSMIFMKLLINIKYLLGSSKQLEIEAKSKQISKHFLELLGENGVFIYPTFPTAAPIGKTIALYMINATYCSIWNILGFPSTHVPMGLNKDGLPIGFQVVAAPYQDRLCLAVARELEKHFGGWIPPYSS